MKYEQMNDEDINHAVLKAIHGDAVDFWALSDCGKFLYDCGPIGADYHQIELKDYCNNPADAWPVIIGNNISTYPMYDADTGANVYEPSGYWCSEHFDMPGFVAKDRNPLRAAMVVFLIMQEGVS